MLKRLSNSVEQTKSEQQLAAIQGQRESVQHVRESSSKRLSAMQDVKARLSAELVKQRNPELVLCRVALGESLEHAAEHKRNSAATLADVEHETRVLDAETSELRERLRRLREKRAAYNMAREKAPISVRATEDNMRALCDPLSDLQVAAGDRRPLDDVAVEARDLVGQAGQAVLRRIADTEEQTKSFEDERTELNAQLEEFLQMVSQMRRIEDEVEASKKDLLLKCRQVGSEVDVLQETVSVDRAKFEDARRAKEHLEFQISCLMGQVDSCKKGVGSIDAGLWDELQLAHQEAVTSRRVVERCRKGRREVDGDRILTPVGLPPAIDQMHLSAKASAPSHNPAQPDLPCLKLHNNTMLSLPTAGVPRHVRTPRTGGLAGAGRLVLGP